MENQIKRHWKQPRAVVEQFEANEYISACGTGTCNVREWGDVPYAPISNYHYELVGTDTTVDGDLCQQVIDITDVDSSFFSAPNAQAVCRDPIWDSKIYEGRLSNIKAWSYNGHLMNNVSQNTDRPNHS